VRSARIAQRPPAAAVGVRKEGRPERRGPVVDRSGVMGGVGRGAVLVSLGAVLMGLLRVLLGELVLPRSDVEGGLGVVLGGFVMVLSGVVMMGGVLHDESPWGRRRAHAWRLGPPP